MEQVAYLGARLTESGVPIMLPVGGHAVCLDAAAMLYQVPREQFPAQTLAAAIYLDSGTRAAERGAVSAGRDPATGENRYPKLELVRLTIPRRVYTRSHLDVVTDSVVRVHATRDRIKTGLAFTHEPKILRFFQARFTPIPE